MLKKSFLVCEWLLTSVTQHCLHTPALSRVGSLMVGLVSNAYAIF